MTTTLSQTTPIARKEHTCIWCREKILKGEKYNRWTGIFDGDFQSNAMHLECQRAFNEQSRIYGYISCDGFEPYSFKRGSMEGK